MTTVTSTGFSRTRLDERLALLQSAVRAIFGQDINLDAATEDGQTLGVFAESISNLDQLAEDAYQSFNPQSASGMSLSRLVQLNGIRRIAGAYSTVSLLCVGTQGTLIPAGSLVSSPSTGSVFTTLADATIGVSGQVTVAAQASTIGAIAAPANTITNIDTPIYGWQTVNNPADALVGRNEETDAELRVRRAASTATPAQSVLDSIYGAIGQVSGVTKLQVFENDQDVADPVTLQLPHSIYAVVEGGANADIAQAIYLRKTAGTTMQGTTSVSVNDTQGNPHTIKFSRPNYVDVYIIVNVSTRAGWPTDGAQQIKDALIAWAAANQSIGEELTYSRLFTPINSIPGHSVSSLYIDTVASPTGVASIAVPFDGLARLDTARITVNVV